MSKARGKASNRKLTEDAQKRAVDLVRERYADFGPTLAAEKLAELHGIAVSRETLRHWLKADGLWLTRKDRVTKPHQPRFRRECLGELVQIDGCEHHWFEDRGPYQRRLLGAGHRVSETPHGPRNVGSSRRPNFSETPRTGTRVIKRSAGCGARATQEAQQGCRGVQSQVVRRSDAPSEARPALDVAVRIDEALSGTCA